MLRPGGRLAVSDVIADPDMDDATRADIRQWTGCAAGALTRDEFERSLSDARLVDVEIRETHRVRARAAAAIVRASKPADEACCTRAALEACCEPDAKPGCCGEPGAIAPTTCGCATS